MNVEALTVLITTQPWLLRIMVVMAIAGIASVLYALAMRIEQLWLRKPRKATRNYPVGNLGTPAMRPDLKCWS